MLRLTTSQKLGASVIFLLGLVALLALNAGCTETSTDSDQGLNDGFSPSPKLAALSPTTSDVTDTLEVTTVRSEGGYYVTVNVGAECPEVAELYFSVTYDATAYRAYDIATNAADYGQSAIGLAVESNPGTIETGLVVTQEAPVLPVQPSDQLLGFKLLPGAARVPSAVTTGGRARARNLELEQNNESRWVLSWDYTNPGDCNQDGEVGISDLTPIGQHYMEHVGNSWDDPLRHIDGDFNGEINLGDITPIGMNYAAELWAYNIEMSEDGESEFILVGQLLLNDQEMPPGETVRFSYTFGSQYVPGAWYRVVPLDEDLQFGTPSEAISETGRRVDPVEVASGSDIAITVYAQNLESALAHMNSVRVVFPASYDYVPGSANVGSPGGQAYEVDGLWSSFATNLLFPPDTFFVKQDLGGGMCAIDFNVTTIDALIPAAPVGYGDLFNFKLNNTGSADLTLEFVAESEDGIKRTYFSNSSGDPIFFGNSIGFRTQ